ncbi:MAG TPA: cupin domain-containing protein [Methanoculleus sp.]|jgi:quercetin dioxygenase-like cupin family protein|nr:cupin domain-containing protein [Methanoculleus sp.]MBP8675990.1 cupin domain-containing protein [Methanoculleus sp.]HOD85502.1 cupin domain-containing protein [Methanoculleus sp.]HON40893.1 cupin domain-containing protein [Methanoculleus sp.]HPD51338.1 cupin domain-containing protein [Methanoculleus sp.]
MVELQDISRLIEEGNTYLPGQKSGTRSAYYSNPDWSGVRLLDLASGADTGGAFSSHLVRVQKGCEVPDHLHENQWEWNAVLAGQGKMILDGREILFGPGDTFTTPPGVRHTVVADKEDIALLAVFVPGTM